MAMSGRVVIRQEDIVGGDGTVETALSLWIGQRPPCTYNQFQSAYFSLLRDFALADENAPEGETPAERGKRVYALYDEIQGSVHGADHREQARQLEGPLSNPHTCSRLVVAMGGDEHPSLLMGRS